MNVISPMSALFILIIIGGLAAACTRGLTFGQRLAAIPITLVVPVLGGLLVILYVPITWSSHKRAS